MRTKLIFSFLFLTMSSSLSFAADTIVVDENKTEQSKESGKFTLGMGPEFRLEERTTGENKVAQSTSIHLGYSKQTNAYILEYGENKNFSATGALSVESKSKNYWAWYHKHLQQSVLQSWLYVGFGLGAYELATTTTILTATDVQKGRLQAMGAASFGFKLESLVGFLLEARVILGDQLNPQPTLGARAAITINF